MSTEKKSLSAKEYPICKIFCDDYLFVIPSYQRPYSWTTEQASELIIDLQDYIKGKSDDIETLNPYFLGSIVLVKGDNPHAEVIDGQQRLTTLSILFSVLRELIDEADIKREITKYLGQKGSKLLKTTENYRISLRDRDKKFFQDYVQDEDGLTKLLDLNTDLPDSHLNIKQNTLCLYKHLKNEEQEELFRLTSFILLNCYLVVVATPDIDSAYRIFSVMNDRGLDLSATDILKSNIIGKIPDSEKQAYTDKWEDIEESIGRDSFNDLFSHIRMIFRCAKPQGTLVKEFDAHVKPGDSPKLFIDDILVPFSEAYTNIILENYASQELAENINSKLKWLNRIDNFDWIPPAILFLSKNKNKPKIIFSFLEKLEKLASCIMIFRGNINYRISRFSDLSKWIHSGKDPLLDNSPIHLTDDEIDNTLSALNGNVYEITRTRLPILLRLDSLLSDGSAQYNYKMVSVEHVLPQNPKDGSQWKTWIPDEDTRKNLVHKLGNLALLSRAKNSSASNYEFDKKKNSYFKLNGVCPFPITTDVLNHNEWTEDIINLRQKDYVRRLAKEWGLSKKIITA
ncbi:MAG: DUF262 domain-containing HNH endonuclease family protein [Proteobacteria bacterium]|nr:DUF262 domain-containing HNH endonuclease family protein [Pseudomonadota bacterium]MBU1389713.1 DUF262 domain-containing HNH endonuclease family protein [Pseudomonadota bacterium]MBU1542651.1 DUF262 domain-containing HNH endonuclease family protein [Pseudomonadota bacterium]